jgi:uncharacterized RDD family membrane protein YckC
VPQFASLARRLLSLTYESLLLAALICFAGLLFLPIFSVFGSEHKIIRHIFQIYLLAIIGTYFIWFWIKGRQTLAMKTWRMKIVDINNNALTPHHALIRLSVLLISGGLALAGYMLLGKWGALLGAVIFIWGFIDRDRQFLHDRIAKTRIILLPKLTAQA